MSEELQHEGHWFAGYRYLESRKCLIDPSGNEAVLRAQSLAVFKYLASRADSVVSKDEIFSAVWSDVSVTDDSLVQCIADIRRVLGDSERVVLRTVPRQGYLLVSDTSDASTVAASADAPPHADLETPSLPKQPKSGARKDGFSPAHWVAVVAILVLFTFGLTGLVSNRGESTISAADAESVADDGVVTVSLNKASGAVQGGDEFLSNVLSELSVALSRYRTIRVVDHPDPDYVVRLAINRNGDSDSRLLVKATDSATDDVLFARTYDFANGSGNAANIATRIAAFASPGGGALWRHLIKTSRTKPLEKLSRAECYALGYGCTKCSGELDSITHRAKACLNALLTNDPRDATAWALKSTLHTHQYGWGSSLDEPERTNLQARRYRADMAVHAADRARELSDGEDTVVDWAMAQAYGVQCDIEKLRNVVDRGLKVNPGDPGLLGSFGSWLAYNGDWDAGVALVDKAVAIEPRHFRRWWLYAPALRHYQRGEYQQAYDVFMRSFNERNWLSHMQLAHTLPFLGRHDEAREAVKRLLLAQPGITIEKGLQVYQAYCVEEGVLAKVKQGLTMAGLPSRGDSTNLSRVTIPSTQFKTIDGRQVEYLDLGQGEPVVFVHGASSDYRMWGYYEVPISDEFRFISYTRQFFGTRPWPEGEVKVGFQDYVNELEKFIESLDTGPVHLVTWSSGGRIGGVLSGKRPDLIKSAIHFEPVENSLILGDDSINEARDALFQRFDLVMERSKSGQRQLAAMTFLEAVFEGEPGTFVHEKTGVKRVVLDNARTIPIVLGPSMRAPMLTCDFLKNVRVPTLVVYGELTNAYWKKMFAKFAQCVPGARLAVLPGVKHDGPIRSVEEFTNLIVGFVREHSKH